MKFLDKDIYAAIFDLDGTTIDSTSIWKTIDARFFSRRGRECPPGYADEIAHIGLEAAATLTREKYGINLPNEVIIKEWRDSCMEEYLHTIPLKDGAKELLIYLKDNGVKLAVATANDKELYEPCLKRLGIYDLFDVIMDVNSCSSGKDSPELYHKVSSLLGVSPKNTIVFEDISIGLRTSYEAGYISVAVYNKCSEFEDDLKKKYSYKYIYSFKELL